MSGAALEGAEAAVSEAPAGITPLGPDDLEYTDLMALAWDPLRGDTSTWPDRALFRSLIEEVGQPVLDIGCGTGRLLLDYLAQGIDIDGLEISPDMVGLLHARAAELGLDVGVRVVIGAMESTALPRRYRLVLVPSSSFQLLTDPMIAAAAMDRFRDLLLPDGRLVMTWIDLPADHPDGADDISAASATLPDGSTIERRLRAWYDAATGLESTDDHYRLLRDGALVREQRIVRDPAVRQYAWPDIDRVHRDAGLEVIELLSGFDRVPARPGDRVVTSIARAIA